MIDMFLAANNVSGNTESTDEILRYDSIIGEDNDINHCRLLYRLPCKMA